MHTKECLVLLSCLQGILRWLCLLQQRFVLLRRYDHSGANYLYASALRTVLHVAVITCE